MAHKPKQDQVIATFEEAFARSWRRLALASTGAVLAISGGADSTALVCAFARQQRRLGVRLAVGTVDHGLRPESADDAAWVSALCVELLGAPAHVLRLALAAGPGVEARAREARYNALHRLREQLGFGCLVTAHTASDQAETVVMRLARGSSLGGVAGIHAARSDGVVRPLLFATRDNVEEYLAALGRSFRHDTMNDDVTFQRVKVRKTVLPTLEQLSPGATTALGRFAAFAAEDDAHLNGEAARALRRIRWPDGTLDLTGLNVLERPIARRAIALFLASHDVELDGELVDDALAAMRQGHAATLPKGRVLKCANGRVCVIEAPARQIHGTSSSGDGRLQNS